MQRIHDESGLCWRRAGEATAQRALVMIHGLASNGTRWREFADNVTDNDELPGWKILAPDLRGHGDSPRRGRIDSTQWMADFHQMLHREQVEACIVGGHCMGANLAIRIACEPRPGLAGLILIEPMVPQAWAGIAARFGRFRFILPVLAGLARAINRLGIGRKGFPGLDLKQSDIQARRDRVDAEGNFNADYASPLRDLRYMPTASYLAALYQTLRPLPEPEVLSCPALALLSAGGLFGDPGKTRQWLERIKQIEIAELEAKHWIPTEQPGAMRRRIVDFCRASDGSVGDDGKLDS